MCGCYRGDIVVSDGCGLASTMCKYDFRKGEL